MLLMTDTAHSWSPSLTLAPTAAKLNIGIADTWRPNHDTDRRTVGPFSRILFPMDVPRCSQVKSPKKLGATLEGPSGTLNPRLRVARLLTSLREETCGHRTCEQDGWSGRNWSMLQQHMWQTSKKSKGELSDFKKTVAHRGFIHGPWPQLVTPGAPCSSRAILWKMMRNLAELRIEVTAASWMYINHHKSIAIWRNMVWISIYINR